MGANRLFGKIFRNYYERLEFEFRLHRLLHLVYIKKEDKQIWRSLLCCYSSSLLSYIKNYSMWIHLLYPWPSAISFQETHKPLLKSLTCLLLFLITGLEWSWSFYGHSWPPFLSFTILYVIIGVFFFQFTMLICLPNCEIYRSRYWYSLWNCMGVFVFGYVVFMLVSCFCWLFLGCFTVRVARKLFTSVR